MKCAEPVTDIRILFRANFSGRYETWHHGLNEAINFNGSPPTADRLTLAGVDYLYRDPPAIRREPCDWHFEAVRYSIAIEAAPIGPETAVLRLHFAPTRIDCFALLTCDLAGFDEPAFAPA